MATRTEANVVYAAGVVQGIALVTFPAASTIFTDPDEYDLSSTQYGTLFLPQVIAAIAAALMDASLGSRFGTKRVYLPASRPAWSSMAVLVVSQFVTDDKTLAYVLLLVATAFLGAGFGLGVPALNTFAAAFPARRTARFSFSTRCSGSAPCWHRCSSRSSSGWGSGGGCRSHRSSSWSCSSS